MGWKDYIPGTKEAEQKKQAEAQRLMQEEEAKKLLEKQQRFDARRFATELLLFAVGFFILIIDWSKTCSADLRLFVVFFMISLAGDMLARIFRYNDYTTVANVMMWLSILTYIIVSIANITVTTQNKVTCATDNPSMYWYLTVVTIINFLILLGIAIVVGVWCMGLNKPRSTAITQPTDSNSVV